MRLFPSTSHQQKGLDNPPPFPSLTPHEEEAGPWVSWVSLFRDAVACGMTGPGHCGEGGFWSYSSQGARVGGPRDGTGFPPHVRRAPGA